jgi:hypothetical protein
MALQRLMVATTFAALDQPSKSNSEETGLIARLAIQSMLVVILL